MKHCDKCGVDVLESLDNCPLCGGYLDKPGERCAVYRDDIEPYIGYPSLKVKDSAWRGMLSLKALLLIVIVSLICVFINRALTPSSLWSAYVAAGELAVYFTAIAAVYRRRRFYAQIAVDALVLTLAAYLVDIVQSLDVSGDLGRFGVSLWYVVPALLFAALIVTDVMVFADRRGNKYYLVTLLVVSLFSLVPQIVVWAGFGGPQWVTVTLFFFALLNGLALTVVCWREIVREVKRKFFV